MIQDLKFALRQLIKSPGFTAVAVFTLAVAIGVNSAIFALINGAILKPVVPLKPEEVVNVFNARQGANKEYRQFSWNEYQAVKQGSEVFADVAAVQFALAGLGRDEGMRRSFAFFASENFFSMLGAKPAIGRFFTEEESRPNANAAVVIVTYSYWKKMGGRADFVGSTMYINARPYTVIGVTPDGFSGLNALLAPDVWLPFGMFSNLSSAFSDSAPVDLAQPKNYTLNIVGRLQPGLTIEAAKARMPAVVQRLNAVQVPDANGARELFIQTPSRFNVSTEPATDDNMTLISTLLMGMAGAVLFIACLNLANMLLARGTARSKEVALRLALGASRWRIVRQLLCEGLLLAILGGLLGLVLSIWSNAILTRSLASLFSSMSFTITLDLRPDAVVLGVTFLFCLFATLLFSLGPALKATRADLVNDLKQQVGEPAHVGRLNRFFAPRHLLVMMQIAVSLVLLFSAALFLRSAMKAGGMNLGFNTRDGLLAEMDFSLNNTDEAVAKRMMFETARRAGELPGVRSVAISTMVPFGNLTNARRVMPANAAPAASADPNQPTAATPVSTRRPRRATSIRSACASSRAAISRSRKPRIRNRRASRSSTSRWRRRCSRRPKRSGSGSATRTRDRRRRRRDGDRRHRQGAPARDHRIEHPAPPLCAARAELQPERLPPRAHREHGSPRRDGNDRHAAADIAQRRRAAPGAPHRDVR
jgi:predicted permease